MENLQHEVMANFRRRNQTVKDWARRHSFTERMVGAVIRGERGNGTRGPKPRVTRAIRQALIEDGYWPVDDDSRPESAVPHRQNS